jgi:hypothetical protein
LIKSCDNSVTILPVSTGHCYKLCPFSDQYYTLWEIDTGVVSSGTLSNIGNSRRFPYGGRYTGVVTYTDDYTKYGTALYATHTNTNGRMITKGRGSSIGWMCTDVDCPHYQGTNIFFLEV